MKQTTSSSLERLFGIALIGLLLLVVGLGAQVVTKKKNVPPLPPSPSLAEVAEVPTASPTPALVAAIEAPEVVAEPLSAPEPLPPPLQAGTGDEETARLRAESAALRRQLLELKQEMAERTEAGIRLRQERR